MPPTWDIIPAEIADGYKKDYHLIFHGHLCRGTAGIKNGPAGESEIDTFVGDGHHSSLVD